VPGICGGGASVLDQPADDVAAHPAETDHAKLHFEIPRNSIQITLRLCINISALKVSPLMNKT
jgi:hypothetical protein